MANLMLDADVAAILKDKIRLVPTERGEIYLVGPIRLPVNLYDRTVEFRWYCWLNCGEAETNIERIVDKLSAANLAERQQSSVLVHGDFERAERALIRFHSICHTGDIFGSRRCDCGYQLKAAMQKIADSGAGALFYLANHEGRGIGLFSKAMAYVLQENGYDTVDANLKLGFADDSRSYDDAIGVLKALRTKPVTLLTNNPKKLAALRRSGMDVADRVELWGGVSDDNRRYLQTKVARSGHLEEGCCDND